MIAVMQEATPYHWYISYAHGLRRSVQRTDYRVVTCSWSGWSDPPYGVCLRTSETERHVYGQCQWYSRSFLSLYYPTRHGTHCEGRPGGDVCLNAVLRALA